MQGDFTDARRADEVASHMLASAILRLPYDTLYLIFLAVNQESGPLSTSSTSNFPVVCTQVCRAWRQMALGMPSLWSFIRFSHQRKGLNALNEEKKWIERSQGAGLQILISFTRRNRTMVQIMRLLRPHVERWKSLVVSARIKPKLIRTIFDGLRDARSSMLEVVKVESEGRMGRWRFQAFGGGAPALRELRIECGRYIPQPFVQLTELCIIAGGRLLEGLGVSIGDLLLILSTYASTLEVLDVRTHITFIPANTTSVSPIILPKLRTLNLNTPSPKSGWFRKLCSGVRAPLLQDCGQDFYPTILLELDRMGAFPFPGLQAVIIREEDTTLPPGTLFSILSQLPNLRRLFMSHLHCFDGRVLATCCPLLEDVVIHLRPRTLNNALGLKDAVETRRHKCASRGIEDSLKWTQVLGFHIPAEEVKWLSKNITYFSYSPY